MKKPFCVLPSSFFILHFPFWLLASEFCVMNEPIATSADQPQPTSSLFSRLTNLFAAPGEVFDEVKASPPSTANWLAPTLILVAVGWIGALIIFSQDSIKQQVNDLSAREIQKQVEKRKLTEAQAEQERARA